MHARTQEVLAAKRALDTAKQQTLDEASKEILAIVVGDKGRRAEDDDKALRAPDRLPSPIAMDSNKIKATSEMTKNSLSSGLSDSDINLPIRSHFTPPTAPARRSFSAHYYIKSDPPLVSRSTSLPLQGYYSEQWQLSYSGFGGQLPARSPTPTSDISSYSNLYNSGHDVSTQ